MKAEAEENANAEQTNMFDTALTDTTENIEE